MFYFSGPNNFFLILLKGSYKNLMNYNTKIWLRFKKYFKSWKAN